MYDAKVIKTSIAKKWIVFIHGFGGSSDTWNKQIESYKNQYNLMLLNMHSHKTGLKLDISSICMNIKESMEFHNVKKAHFVSSSFGSMLAVCFAGIYPEMVDKMVMGGGIIRFDSRTRFLVHLAGKLKNVIPYMQLYRFFAFIIMPRKNHKKSREIFVREAKRMGFSEFIKWVDLIPDAEKALCQTIGNINIPMLYIMGSQDYLFLPIVKDYTNKINNIKLKIIPHCGHVCYIEKANEFNRSSIIFLY